MSLPAISGSFITLGHARPANYRRAWAGLACHAFTPISRSRRQITTITIRAVGEQSASRPVSPDFYAGPCGPASAPSSAKAPSAQSGAMPASPGRRADRVRI
jgi:hypothetical protein